MYNIFKKHRRWKLICAILSLSLLTVMAGAAVAPALGLIQAYFADTDRSLVQMIVSMPALFIAGTNLFLFKPLCKRFRARTLLIFGLLLYTVFGCLAGLFSNILMILVCRALVGIGVGIIMPLSTGLLSFYFTRDKQGPLMGYSSALNMLGGVVATLIAGGLAMISWRLSFMVYLMGLISIVLCIIWMPNDRIYDSSRKAQSAGSSGQYAPYILVMFVLSFTFFVYPANFALECSSSGAIPQGLIAPVMAMMDVFGFAGGWYRCTIHNDFRIRKSRKGCCNDRNASHFCFTVPGTICYSSDPFCNRAFHRCKLIYYRCICCSTACSSFLHDKRTIAGRVIMSALDEIRRSIEQQYRLDPNIHISVSMTRPRMNAPATYA